jgi:anti-sigma B factor antagonist
MPIAGPSLHEWTAERHECPDGRRGRYNDASRVRETSVADPEVRDMELEVSSRLEKDACVVLVTGEVDVYTSPSLKSALMAAAEEDCPTVIADMSGVDFIDSSGLGVLVGALRRAREAGGDLRVVCDKENIVKIFRITGLDRVFPMFSTLDQAFGA